MHRPCWMPRPARRAAVGGLGGGRRGKNTRRPAAAACSLARQRLTALERPLARRPSGVLLCRSQRGIRHCRDGNAAHLGDLLFAGEGHLRRRDAGLVEGRFGLRLSRRPGRLDAERLPLLGRRIPGLRRRAIPRHDVVAHAAQLAHALGHVTLAAHSVHLHAHAGEKVSGKYNRHALGRVRRLWAAERLGACGGSAAARRGQMLGGQR